MPSQPLQIEKLIKKSQNPELVGEAFSFAKEIYRDKKRLSGENYIEHALRVAIFLSNMKADQKTIISALLHDAIDDKPIAVQNIELAEIKKKFGKEVEIVIKKVSHLSKIRRSLAINLKEKKSYTKERIENLRKMFLALAENLEVVLIELASRLDGLEHLKNLSQDKQKLYAIETLEIFSPIANRLGLSEIKRRLEDLSFYYLFPDKYNWLKENIETKYVDREKKLKSLAIKLKKIFKKERIKTLEINFRTKSYWSTYQKLFKKDMNFEKIYDLVALRIITEKTEDCYKILGIVHKYFKPISEEINDYIAKPKLNGYRSLHTTIYNQNSIAEIQIRTQEMHKEAEYGVCAHWSYKEKIDLKNDKEKLEFSEKIPDFWKNFKIDFFENQVFVFTPKGDVFSLKKGSCPIDFAYAVHSDIGNHCESARIAGKIVQLSHIIENGDIIEIITNKKKYPSQDWLKFVKTNLAQSHIKKFFTEKNPETKFSLPRFIKKKIFEIAEKTKKGFENRNQFKRERPREIYLAGERGMMVSNAKCCNPKPGDQVKAYLAKHKDAVVLHNISCKNLQKLEKVFPEKIIEAYWK